MAWLFAIVVLGLAVWSRGFRKVLLVVVVLGTIGVAGWFGYERRQDRIAKSLVSPSQVVLEDEQLRGRDSSYNLTGRLRNKSQYTINQVDVKVVLRDCIANAVGPCDIVGQATDSVFVSIPPSQVRDIESLVYFSPAPVFRGEPTRQIEIVAVRASR